MWPNFLPDGKHFVYAALRKNKKHDVLLGTIGSETSEILVRNASYPKYAPPDISSLNATATCSPSVSTPASCALPETRCK